MVITKNQIRPRRIKCHFTNADILAFDGVGIVDLIPAAGTGFATSIKFVQFVVNVISIYTNIDATNPRMFLYDDFQQGTYVEDIGGMGRNLTNFSGLFGQTGLNVLGQQNQSLLIDATATTFRCEPETVFSWSDLHDIGTGMSELNFINGASGDLTGGNPANFMDVYVDYDIINLT